MLNILSLLPSVIQTLHFVLESAIFKKRRGIEKGVSEKSFYNARAELIKNKIIALKNGTTYWYNFNYFFNGDRFSVVKEYVLGETKNSVEVKALEVPKIATGTKGVSPLQRLNFDSKGEEVKNDYYESLTEDDCSKVPVKELKSLNKDEYPKHSPIWWAIISAQSKNKKYTHTS